MKVDFPSDPVKANNTPPASTPWVLTALTIQIYIVPAIPRVEAEVHQDLVLDPAVVGRLDSLVLGLGESEGAAVGVVFPGLSDMRFLADKPTLLARSNRNKMPNYT